MARALSTLTPKLFSLLLQAQLLRCGEVGRRELAPVWLAAMCFALTFTIGCGGGGVNSSSRAQISGRFSSSSLAFGNQPISTLGASQTVTVTNTGILDYSFASVKLGGSNVGDFVKAGDTCTGAAILPQTSCTVNVQFAPAGAGDRSATLVFTDNASDSPQTINLTGTGVNPTAITVSPSSAGVAPSATTTFSAAIGGFPTSSVAWSVNGMQGGSATVGVISSTGVYTAPQTASPLLVTVAATLTFNTNVSASASVAVMIPGTVASTHNPQVASYSLTVPDATTVAIQFGTTTDYGLTTWTRTAPSGGGAVQIFVAGMLGFTTYHMRAVAKFADGTQYNDVDHVFTTGGLSAAQLPSLTATTTAGQQPNGGIELLNLVYTVPVGTAENLVATDLNGNIIWYFDPGIAGMIPEPAQLLPNGDVLINYNDPGIDGYGALLEEVDLAGNVIWQMSAGSLNSALANAGYNISIVGTHHDVAVLPNGHLIVIASVIQNFNNLTGYPGTTAVTGDVLIDLDTNRKPVWVWSEFDHLDVNRHPMGFPDWTHTNAVLYSPSDGNLVISIRHQHWLIKIDYNNGAGTGDIVWKLGWQGDFTLKGGTDPVDWFYAQHGPDYLSSTTSGTYQMTLFDNGDNRPSLPGGQPCGQVAKSPCASRVPIIGIDESAKTATINWVDTLGMFSFFGGNAEFLGNGDIELDECASGGSAIAATVTEVTQTTPPKTVWQLQVTGQYAYRAKRVPSLYPGVQW